MILELRQFDNKLITFEYIKGSFGEDKCRIKYIVEENRCLLPIGMDADGKGILSWLKKRVIPQNREFADTLLARNRLSHGDTLGIIRFCKGLSLNDCYWVVEEGFNGSFSDYNLYKNKFVKIQSLIAYTGHGSIKANGFSSSPEFTTNGMLRKGWRRLNGEIYLYKGGTNSVVNAGNEQYSEFYASQIASIMGLNHIDYKLSMWKGSLCSKCKLFTDINTSYVPINQFVKKPSLIAVANFLKTLGNDFYNEFCDMLIFDSLICNTDRHMGNFGILVDNKTNKPISFAPIFDNGLSLFNYGTDVDFENLEEYYKTRKPALAESYEIIVKEFLFSRQKAKLRKMIDFKFKRDKTYNLSVKRLKKIEEFLQKRVKKFLDTPEKGEK